MSDRKLVTGLFKDPSKAAAAVNDLSDRGVPTGTISAIVSEPAAQEAFAIESHSKVGEGAAIGAGTGGALGALIAGFTAVGALATTGVGLLAAGPIVAALAGAGAGAAAGGVVGGLIGLGIPENEIKRYEEHLEEGAVLLTVDVSRANASTVKDVLKKHDVDTLGQV